MGLRRKVAVAGLAGTALVVWLRNGGREKVEGPGARFVNRTINPFLVGRRLGQAEHPPIGVLEHVGRSSGRTYRTPLYLGRTATGIVIPVPLKERSQWARNVVAAGHCRAELNGTVYDLDEPKLVGPGDENVRELPIKVMAKFLSMEYLVLHVAGSRPGSLDDAPGSEAPPA